MVRPAKVEVSWQHGIQPAPPIVVILDSGTYAQTFSQTRRIGIVYDNRLSRGVEEYHIGRLGAYAGRGEKKSS
jgi:hypothetical protein